MRKILTVLSLGLYEPKKSDPDQDKTLIIKNKTKKFLRVTYRDKTQEDHEAVVPKFEEIKITLPSGQSTLKFRWSEKGSPTRRELFVPVGKKVKKVTAFNRMAKIHWLYGPEFRMGIQWS